MGITWRDGIATVLVGASGVITYARVKGFSWPLLGSWRLASAVLLVIGFATCIVIGSGVTPVKSAWTIMGGTLGVAAFIVGLLAIITNKELFFLSLAGLVVSLWMLATIHHLAAA